MPWLVEPSFEKTDALSIESQPDKTKKTKKKEAESTVSVYIELKVNKKDFQKNFNSSSHEIMI